MDAAGVQQHVPTFVRFCSKILWPNATKKSFRRCVASSLSSYMLASQTGGFLRRGTDFGHQLLKLALKKAAHRSWSAITLFVDVSNAFATVQRSIAFDHPMDDHQVMQLFLKLGSD